jgi:hypothetical protein
MLDDLAPRLTFRLDLDTLARVQTLAQRYEVSVSEVCRDALELLLADLRRYHDLRMSRLPQHHTPPTDAQLAAQEGLMAAAMRLDLDAIAATMTPP